MKRSRTFYVVNSITIYRLIAAPVLIVLIFIGEEDIFKWLLPVSFFTDMVDGYLARKFNAISVLGSRLDSIADDLTVVAAIIGLFMLKPDFISEQWLLIIPMIALFLIQTALALVKYKKISSFHTYSAKTAAVFQGTFLILIFLLPNPLYILFYLASALTIIDLLEEIILILLLPKWKANVKGIYWVMKRKHVIK
jgi:cardiolipin synthase